MSDHHFTTVGSGPHEGAIEDCARCKSREEYKNRTEFLLGRDVFEFDREAEKLVLPYLDPTAGWEIEDTAMMTYCLSTHMWGKNHVSILVSPMVETNNEDIGKDHDYLWSASVEIDGQDGQGEYPRGPEPNTATPQEVAKWINEVVMKIAGEMVEQ